MRTMLHALAGLLTIDSAAARRGCSVSTIYRHIARERLHPRRVLGRVVVEIDEVDALPGPEGGGRWRTRGGAATSGSTRSDQREPWRCPSCGSDRLAGASGCGPIRCLECDSVLADDEASVVRGEP